MLLPGFEGPNLHAWGVVSGAQAEIQTGSEAMTAQTFGWKSKRVAGMAIGAIAMLAVAGPALTDDNGDDNGNGKKDEVFQVTTVIQVPGTTTMTPFFSFDISWFDPTHKKFFLADRNSKAVDVVDATKLGQGVVAQFKPPPPQAFAGPNANPDLQGPNGVLTANNDTELWVGDTPGRVWVFDSGTGAKITLPAPATNPISVGGATRADELCYDPKDNLIMIASPGEGFVSFISTAGANKGQVVGQISFGAPATGIEQCGWSPTTGKFYQNLPGDPPPAGGQDRVAVITPSTTRGGVLDHFIAININDCSGLRGMAIGPDNQILLGCNAAATPGGPRNSLVIDARSGATATVLKVLTELGGVDQVWFNPDDNHYILPSCNGACRQVPGGPELLFIVDSSGIKLDSSVTIGRQNGDTTPLPPPNPRVVHSAAAGGNLIFLPIPAVGGGTVTVPRFDPTLCDTFDDFTRVGSPSTAVGCIVILQAKPDKDDKVAKKGEGNDNSQGDDNSQD